MAVYRSLRIHRWNERLLGRREIHWLCVLYLEEPKIRCGEHRLRRGLRQHEDSRPDETVFNQILSSFFQTLRKPRRESFVEQVLDSLNFTHRKMCLHCSL